MPETAPVFRVTGHGPVHVIVSHGWIAGAALFDPVADLLDRGHYTFAFVEHRGYGAASHLPAAGLAGSTADVLAAADRLGWNRFAVLGHSMGGLVAQHLSVTAPERLTGVVLLSSVPASGGQLSDEVRAQRREAVHSAEQRRRLIAANSGCGPELADRIWRMSMETASATAMERYLDDWSRADFGAEVADAGGDVDCLVVTGERDPAVTTALMRSTVLGTYPHARLVELGGVGHYAMQQAPQRLLNVLTSFL
ncbi:alpha/beta hydrolase [Streptomyces sp. NPDC001027]|uniref:alpha/beta fold hydrolase n=1 Tax=Streptomyces sp. NPDC001027 TaxID=3154771 RepID=UPI00332A5A01